MENKQIVVRCDSTRPSRILIRQLLRRGYGVIRERSQFPTTPIVMNGDRITRGFKEITYAYLMGRSLNRGVQQPKIILFCDSGPKSRALVRELILHGYANQIVRKRLHWKCTPYIEDGNDRFIGHDDIYYTYLAVREVEDRYRNWMPAQRRRQYVV